MRGEEEKEELKKNYVELEEERMKKTNEKDNKRKTDLNHRIRKRRKYERGEREKKDVIQRTRIKMMNKAEEEEKEREKKQKQGRGRLVEVIDMSVARKRKEGK